MTHVPLLRAAWVAEGLLLLAAGALGEGSGRGDGPEATRLRGGAVAARGGGSAGADAVVAARIPVGLLDDPAVRLVVDAGQVAVDAGAADLRDALTDLRTFLREQVAPWDAEGRAAVVAMVLSIAADASTSTSLAEGLRDVRDALRERQAIAVVDERADRALHVERLHRIDDNAFYASGWVWEPFAPLVALTAISPEGERVELLEHAFRHARDDVGERFGAAPDRGGDEPAGFICHFETAGRSVLADGWVFEANGGDRGVETHVALTTTDAAATRAAIVADAGLEPPQADALRDRHVRPALTRLQELRRESAAIATDEAFGAPPRSPEVSVVVPLFERTDLLEHQLVQFADDPAMRDCELIYVLDSPEQRDHLRAFAAELFRLYGLPFRLVTLEANGGVSLAREAGASVAAGRRLLFLDSDVLPDRPGWLPRLSGLLRADPRIGALAPKLVYEDETVQHGGLTLERPPGGSEWGVEHRFKGVHRSTPAANAGGPVPAVTGACLMVDAGLYRNLGGMSWLYVQGDYEDTDLCMRLAEAGYRSWYAPEVELYHLEGQSYAAESRTANRRYNRWLHTRLWGERIEAVG